MSDERGDSPSLLDRPVLIDLSEPHGPMDIKDWAELYPMLPLRTISLCVWEAHNTSQSHDSDEMRNALMTRLIAARLEESRQSVSP
jgi:hypothetical protein